MSKKARVKSQICCHMLPTPGHCWQCLFLIGTSASWSCHPSSNLPCPAQGWLKGRCGQCPAWNPTAAQPPPSPKDHRVYGGSPSTQRPSLTPTAHPTHCPTAIVPVLLLQNSHNSTFHPWNAPHKWGAQVKQKLQPLCLLGREINGLQWKDRKLMFSL